MNRIIGKLAVSALLFGASFEVASAADMPLKAPAYAAAPDWTGFYAGATIGVRWADPGWTTTALCPLTPGCAGFAPPDASSANASFDSTSFRSGGYVGYNWQLAPTWIFGLEADLADANNSKTIAGIPGTFGPALAAIFGPVALGPGVDTSAVRETWDGSVRGRFGFLMTPTWLIYGTAGVAGAGMEVSESCGPPFASPWCGTGAKSETVGTTRVGWTTGVGIETMFAKNWLVRAEYRYADYGAFNQIFFPPGSSDDTAVTVRLRSQIASIGIAYRFDTR